jgi:Domain of unknown function (DUF1833)
LAQLYSQQSDDVFLILLTLSHPTFASDIRLVNNSTDIVSRGDTFTAFPFKIRLPVDDGESNREVSIEFDNVSLELLDELRTVTTSIEVNIEMILNSLPDEVQISLGELKIQTVSYNKQTVSARLFLDSFLTTELNSEVYSPSVYPGIF